MAAASDDDDGLWEYERYVEAQQEREAASDAEWWEQHLEDRDHEEQARRAASKLIRAGLQTAVLISELRDLYRLTEVSTLDNRTLAQHIKKVRALAEEVLCYGGSVVRVFLDRASDPPYPYEALEGYASLLEDGVRRRREKPTFLRHEIVVRLLHAVEIRCKRSHYRELAIVINAALGRKVVTSKSLKMMASRDRKARGRGGRRPAVVVKKPDRRQEGRQVTKRRTPSREDAQVLQAVRDRT